MAKVTHLFIKKTKGEAMQWVNKIDVTVNGIVDAVDCLPQRQILILSAKTLTNFNIKPGELKENVVIEFSDFETITSGMVIKIGNVKIRITYQCEPCINVKKLANPKQLINKRGILGTILNSGSIKINDCVSINTELKFEPIPYEIKDRIIWFLDKQIKPIKAIDLVKNIGLGSSYCRALPNVMRKMDDKYKNLVVFKTKV
jgi:hypothetical protein